MPCGSPTSARRSNTLKPAKAWAAAALVALLGLGIGEQAIYHAARTTHRASANHATRGQSSSSFRLDINRASAQELAVLPGVGPTLARRIVQYRRRVGPFTNPAELEAVSRMGPITRRRIEPWVRFSKPPTEPTRLADRR